MENIKITTSGGYIVTLKPYITGKEKRYITDSFLEDAEMVDGKFKLAPGKMHVAEDRAIEAVVISIDGIDSKGATMLDAVLNLPMADFDEVKKAINEITETKKKD